MWAELFNLEDAMHWLMLQLATHGRMFDFNTNNDDVTTNDSDL